MDELNGLDFATWLKVYDRNLELRTWIRNSWAKGIASGGSGVEACSYPDGPVIVRKLLKALQSMGKVRRLGWEPSTSQRVMGVGGGTIESKERDLNVLHNGKEFHAECWTWQFLEDPDTWLPPLEPRRPPRRAGR